MRPRSASASSVYSNRSNPKMRTLYKDKKSNTILFQHPSNKNNNQSQNNSRGLQFSKVSQKQPQIANNYHITRPSSARHSSSVDKTQKLSQSVTLRQSKSANKKQQNIFEQLDNQFAKTSLKLTKQAFKHHNPDICVCAQCTCGRHLCKIHPLAPNLTKRSTYTQDYNKKGTYPNKCYIAGQQQYPDKPNFQPNSTYGKDFPGKKNDDLSRPKPQDNLKTGGPCANLTSYTAGFPGHIKPNQYIKPTDNHRRQKFPLRGRTTYDTQFIKKTTNNDFQKIPDNLKGGKDWLGSTTYNNFFKSPNPQNYATLYKHKQKHDENPNYKHQFQTSYGDNFINHGNRVCPAKIQLERRSKSQLKDSKLNYNQNFQYKGLSHIF